MTMTWYIYALIIGVPLLIALFAASYKKAPPDTAFFRTGLGKSKVRIGGAFISIPFLQRVDKVPLNIIPVDIQTRTMVPTNEFIHINVVAIANVKISAETDHDVRDAGLAQAHDWGKMEKTILVQ